VHAHNRTSQLIIGMAMPQNLIMSRSTSHVACLLVALALLLAPCWSADQFVPVKKPCPAGCEKNGNCNFEDGRCECPWGYAGDDCSKLMMPACRQLPDSKLISCDETMAKNCECFRWVVGNHCFMVSIQVSLSAYQCDLDR
jgi:hypothetical protein